MLNVVLIKPWVNTLSSDNKTEREVERKRAGLSFLIVNLGVPWALRLNSPVLLRSCPKRVLFFFLEGNCHIGHENNEVWAIPTCYCLTFTCCQPCLPNFQCFQSCASWTPLCIFSLCYVSHAVVSSRGAARIFLRGGLKLWKQKPWKGKIACD